MLISAFVFPGGAPEGVYRRVLGGQLTLVTSPPLLGEFGRVLGEKFGWDPTYAEEAVGQLVRIAMVVNPAEEITDIAEVIVSGDRHLLSLGTWRDIRVLPPARFADEIS